MLSTAFFNQDPKPLAIALLGKVIWRNVDGHWIGAQIIETEAYYLEDKASHASLGWTPKREALFMAPGTIYMYYARGGDSFNISAKGNAVLIKSAYPFLERPASPSALPIMQRLNPPQSGVGLRALHQLCNGQTLLCRALHIKVPEWDKKQFEKECFFIACHKKPLKRIIQTKRLGIPKGRDEEKPYRFIDENYARFATKNPLSPKKAKEGQDYHFINV